jgi:hypothetical protein
MLQLFISPLKCGVCKIPIVNSQSHFPFNNQLVIRDGITCIHKHTLYSKLKYTLQNGALKCLRNNCSNNPKRPSHIEHNMFAFTLGHKERSSLVKGGVVFWDLALVFSQCIADLYEDISCLLVICMKTICLLVIYHGKTE